MLLSDRLTLSLMQHQYSIGVLIVASLPVK